MLATAGAVAIEALDPADPDRGVAAHYGDPLREQRLLATAAGVVDRGNRGVLAIAGEDRLTWLHSLTTQHLLKIVVFGIAGFAFWEWLPLIAAMILSGFVGTVYGTSLLERMPEKTFRIWFKIGITLLALDLLRRGLMAL